MNHQLQAAQSCLRMKLPWYRKMRSHLVSKIMTIQGLIAANCTWELDCKKSSTPNLSSILPRSIQLKLVQRKNHWSRLMTNNRSSQLRKNRHKWLLAIDQISQQFQVLLTNLRKADWWRRELKENSGRLRCGLQACYHQELENTFHWHPLSRVRWKRCERLWLLHSLSPFHPSAWGRHLIKNNSSRRWQWSDQ